MERFLFYNGWGVVWVAPKVWWYGQMCQSLYLSIKILIHYIFIWKWPHSFSVREKNDQSNITKCRNCFFCCQDISRFLLCFIWINFECKCILAATVLLDIQFNRNVSRCCQQLICTSIASILEMCDDQLQTSGGPTQTGRTFLHRWITPQFLQRTNQVTVILLYPLISTKSKTLATN